MRRLLLAIGFLTRLPVPHVASDADDFAAAIRFYPVAGLIVGLVIAVAARLGAIVDGWTAALAGVVAWTLVTGALHLDGLGDVADGIGAGHRDRARTIAAMADPHVGSFGVVAIALQLLAKLVLLHAVLPGGFVQLILVPAVARIGPLAWARLLPPLKPGLGATVAGAVRARDILGWAALLCAAAVAFPALVAAPILIVAFAWWLGRRLGGINGDGHGAGIELVETGLLAASAFLGAS